MGALVLVLLNVCQDNGFVCPFNIPVIKRRGIKRPSNVGFILSKHLKTSKQMPVILSMSEEHKK